MNKDNKGGRALLFGLSILCSAIFTSTAFAERYMVLFNSQTTPDDASQVIAAAHGQMVLDMHPLGTVVAVSSDPNFITNVKSSSEVMDAAVDIPLTIQSAGTPESTLNGTQWNLARIHAYDAQQITKGSHNTTVLVIDSGIAFNDPDLGANMVYAGCISPRSNFTLYSQLPPFEQDPSAPCNIYPYYYHGTAVASIIASAGRINYPELGGSFVGVGPDLGLASINVMDNDPNLGLVLYGESIFQAMLAAPGLPVHIDVVNMSVGSMIPRHLPGLNVIKVPYVRLVQHTYGRAANYLKRNGILLVSAAGNDFTNTNSNWMDLPADDPTSIGVGGTGIRPTPQYVPGVSTDVLAFYSNTGHAVDIVAPSGDFGPDFPNVLDYSYGVPVLYVNIDPNLDCSATWNCPVTVANDLGTSFSSPAVAGTAGLLIDYSKQHGIVPLPNQVKSIILRSADSLGNQVDFGAGMLNVLTAVQSAPVK